jgi:hypothetical protein
MQLVWIRCRSLLDWLSVELTRSAWEEIHEVFGDGTDYDWALDAQAEGGDAEQDQDAKKDLRLEDVSTRFVG